VGGERCPEGPGNEADCTEGRNEVEEPGTGLQAAGTGLEETDDRTRCSGNYYIDGEISFAPMVLSAGSGSPSGSCLFRL
jgi:hypothetical protein